MLEIIRLLDSVVGIQEFRVLNVFVSAPPRTSRITTFGSKSAERGLVGRFENQSGNKHKSI